MKIRLAHVIFSLLVVAHASAADRQRDPSTFTWNPELSKEGPVLVAVSLKSQTAAVYRNGIEIGSCKVSTGKPGHESPTGVFHILNKDADHHSSTYNNASMPFSERLTWGGVALHAGSLPGYPSSHGCIHLPYEFSRRLFGITHKGTTVVISNESPDVHVSHDHHVGVRGGDSTEFGWNPQASPAGPISLLYSAADDRVFVIRNGITIGECKTQNKLFSARPKGTSAFVFTGWHAKGSKPTAEPHWIQVGGKKESHAAKISESFKVDPHFQHLMEALITPGTTLVVTSDSATEKTRSHPGFQILQGGMVESVEKKEQTPTPAK
jgi:hypothetical protein